MGKIATVNPFLGIDLLSDARSSAYFVMKDTLIHFFSIQSVEYRRDFNLEVAAALDNFAIPPKKVREALHEAYTIGYERARTSPARPECSDLSEVIFDRVPNAHSFFRRHDLTDTATLKSAYRKQSKIHHPDVGGTHEAMLLLNDAFNAIFEIIASGQADILPFGRREGRATVSGVWAEVDTTPYPHSTWCGWLGPFVWGTFSHGTHIFRPIDADKALQLLRVSLAIDEYELTEATELIRNILSKNLTSGERDFGWNYATIEASIQLCRRLRASLLDVEAEEIARMVVTSKLNSHLYWRHISKELDKVMLRDARPKVNPLYPRHRANWERYLPQKKTGTAKRLLAARQARDTQFRNAVSALGGFVNLTQDPSQPQISSPTLENIPQPNPWAAISPEQAWEYHSAFYLSPSLDLVRKHLSLRCDMWFCALFDVNVPLGSLLVEITTVAQFIPQTLYRTPIRQRIESLVPRFTFMDFIDFLFNLPPEQARHRLDFLTAIDKRYAAAIRSWVTTHVMQNSYVVRTGISFRDVCFPDIRDTFFRERPEQLSLSGQWTLNPVLVRSWRKEWFKAACAPIEQLEHALETGWMAPRHETIARAWQRWHDYSVASELTEKLGRKKGDKLTFESSSDQLFVSIAEEAIKACFTHMSQTEFIEELYLGWWSDNLAKALLRLGDTAAAHRVAICFLDLPTRAHAWTTEKEMDFLLRIGRPQP